MSRPLRILLELTGPTLFAIVLARLVFLFLFPEEHRLADVPHMVKETFEVVPFAFKFAAAPSAVFALVLEIAFARGLAQRSWRTVAFAAALGVLGGLAVSAMLLGGVDVFTLAVLALGSLAGALVGIVILAAARIADRRAARAKLDLSSVF